MRQSNAHRGKCVVLNASSLNSFVKTQCFDLVRRYFGSVVIPRRVRDEFSTAFDLPDGLVTRTLTDSQRRQAQALGLHPGESEAIILARDLDVPLIMDDSLARKVANRLNVIIIGSIVFVQRTFIDCLIEQSEYDSRVSAFEQSGRANASIIAWARSARKRSPMNQSD